MSHVTLKAAIAAILVAAPLAGVHAEPLTRPSPADRAYSESLATNIDNVTTGAINSNRAGNAAAIGQSPADASYAASVRWMQDGANVTYGKLIDSQIKAAQASLVNVRQNGPVSEASLRQLRAEIASIRQAADQEAGALSEGTYQALSNQLNSVHQGIYALING